VNTVDLLKYGLDIAFEVLDYVTNDLTQEQIDWQPPGVACSIGSILSHLNTYLDFFLREVCIEKRFEILKSPPPPEIVMKEVQVDLHDMQIRTENIRTITKDWLSSLTPADLEIEFESAIGTINVGQMIEAYIIWHINVHCGEISLLKGCQGAKGYPW
jgi:hypothetical protein